MQCDNYMYQRRRRPSESDYHARILSLCVLISFIPSYRLKPSAQSTASSLVGLRVLDHYLFVQLPVLRCCTVLVDRSASGDTALGRHVLLYFFVGGGCFFFFFFFFFFVFFFFFFLF